MKLSHSIFALTALATSAQSAGAQEKPTETPPSKLKTDMVCMVTVRDTPTAYSTMVAERPIATAEIASTKGALQLSLTFKGITIGQTSLLFNSEYRKGRMEKAALGYCENIATNNNGTVRDLRKNIDAPDKRFSTQRMTIRPQ